jgi:phosphohistidine phosphatase
VGKAAVELWLLRHAKAEKAGSRSRDEERALTAGALKKMRQAARTIARLEPGFDAVLTSPLRRARETAEPVTRALGLRKRMIETVALEPEADPADVLREVERLEAGRVLLVGHMPHLGRLLGLLVTGRSNVSIEIGKGSLARIEFEGDTPDPPGVLTLFLPLKELAKQRRVAL